MSPTGVFVVFLLALYIDWTSIGPTGLRDRIAFLLGLAAIREGFNGSTIDKWTVDKLAWVVDQGKEAAGDAYVALAVTEKVIGAAVGIVALYALGVMLPNRTGKWFGAWARLTFRPATRTQPGEAKRPLSKQRLNLRLWVCAALLGLMADLTGGWLGKIANTLIDIGTWFAARVPGAVFGA